MVTATSPRDNPRSALLARASATLDGYLALGNLVEETPQARFVSNARARDIRDANHVSGVTAHAPGEIDEVLAHADEVFAGLGHRHVFCGPCTPPEVEARLLLEGYRADAELQMILEGDLHARVRPVPIRPVESDADWSVLARLTRLDHEEEGRKRGRSTWSEDVTRQMVATKRAKAPDLRFWLATADGVDCGFFSSWPGVEGVGKVEDLFTQPDFRRRGIATALIAHAVADARARGAGPVLIGAEHDDTPKHMYAAMGFRPLCATRSYVKQVG
jgi:GNAT superfamily N-acetyltransferase